MRDVRNQTSRKRPRVLRFTEATPRLEARKLVRARTGWVGFAVERASDGRSVVDGSVSASEDDEVVITWESAERAYWARQTLAEQQAGDAPAKMRFVCAGCGKLRDIIYLDQEIWRCRSCHNLKYESQYKSTYDKHKSEIIALQGELSLGRKKYERIQSWDAKNRRYAELRSYFESALMAPTHSGIRVERVETHYVYENSGG